MTTYDDLIEPTAFAIDDAEDEGLALFDVARAALDAAGLPDLIEENERLRARLTERDALVDAAASLAATGAGTVDNAMRALLAVSKMQARADRLEAAIREALAHRHGPVVGIILHAALEDQPTDLKKRGER